MTNTSYPGVYIQEVNDVSLSVASGATAVPVFIGIFSAKDGSSLPSTECIYIENWLDFTSRFVNPNGVEIGITHRGGHAHQPILTFEYDETNGALALQHYFQNQGGACYILPLNEAKEGELTQLPAAIAKYPEISLLVCPETDETLGAGVKQKVYAALNPLLTKNLGYFLIADSTDGDADIPKTEKMQTAVYYPALVTPFKRLRPEDAKIPISWENHTSVTNLSQIEAQNPLLYQAISDELDANFERQVTLPASAAVAGAYCQTDRERGVWKAPANIALQGVSAVTTVVSDTEQGSMNEQGINVIRSFHDRGIMIWGARTLVLGAQTDWRYIPVRRLFNAAQRDIQRAMRFAVFEPNSQPTWERVRAAINNYLYALWQQGGLQGNTEKEAYFVQIGLDVTMTEKEIEQGKMIVKVGMSAVRPAEFIILQFTQNVGNA